MSLATTGKSDGNDQAPQSQSVSGAAADERRRLDAESDRASDDSEEDDWSDGDDADDEEEESDPLPCLFCPTTLPSLPSFHSHTISAHGSFDFRSLRASWKLDFYQQMKLINYVREQVSNGVDASIFIALFALPLTDALNRSELKFLFDGSESYLKPHREEDPLLFSLPSHSNGSDDDDEDGGEEEKKTDDKAVDDASAASSSAAAPSIASVLRENQQLRNELESMQEAMVTMQATLQRVAFEEEERKSPADASASSSSSSSIAPAASSSSSSECVGSFAPAHIDRDYFGGYSTRNIHELMLRDRVRTEAYRDFIYGNPQLFKDKIVLDVGCGTGILSLFAAKCGAKKVIAVDAADIVHKAREIVNKNGYADVITILHGKMEEVTLPVDKVDIIISEWMGYFLLFESMLPSVLYARDRYLRSTNTENSDPSTAAGVYPDQAIMYVSGIETSAHTARRVHWWSDVYGFDFSNLVEENEKHMGSTVEIVRPHQIRTSIAELNRFNVMTVVDSELDFTQSFELVVHDDRPSADEAISAFMVYFDTPFQLYAAEGKSINLSTAPVEYVPGEDEKTTHWQQACFYIAQPIQANKGDVIKGKLKAKRMKKNPRAYNVQIEYCLHRDGKDGDVCIQDYEVQ